MDPASENLAGGMSRRGLLRAGSALSLVYLSGCGAGGRVSDELASPAWPEPVMGPVPPKPVASPVVTVPAAPVAQPAAPVVVSEPVVAELAVIPRTRWTSAGVKRSGNALPMRGVSRVTVHHDALLMTSDSEAAAIGRLNSIQSAHLQRRSKRGEAWADIGYHYVVDRAGRVWEGRPVSYQGAHVEDHNEHNVGVMCMGNFVQQSPARAQTESLDRLLAWLMGRHAVPIGRVYTHQELDSTACPGVSLQRFMVATRRGGGGLAVMAGRG